LAAAGHERIILLDNASTYPPLLEWYKRDCPHTVVRLGRNLGKLALWKAGLEPSEPFVYTDPDVVPTEDCPPDLVERLAHLLARHPVPKVGPGLFLDDVPPSLRSLSWERGPQINGREIEPGARLSLIDTTFALYRPGIRFNLEAIRTDHPYQARHLSWYREKNPTDEDRFYLQHAIAGPEGSSWAQQVRCG